MLEPATPAPLLERRAVTISLIGDLDADLGGILAEALDDLANRGTCDIVVDFDRVAAVHGSGLAAASRALAQHHFAGRSVVASTRKRLVRAALAAARVPLAPRGAEPPKVERHVMIAHHSEA
jgi:anti-anti-sigma regulatory factor